MTTFYPIDPERQKRYLAELYQLRDAVDGQILELGGQPKGWHKPRFVLLERFVRWVLYVTVERPAEKAVDATLAWLDKKLRDRKR